MSKMMDIFVRDGMNYDRDAVSRETGIYTDLEEEPSLTQQSFKEESDINEIVRRFGLTGQLPDNYQAPLTGDFTDVVDYKTALDAVIAADEKFLELPAHIREKFQNDPQQLLTFLDDDSNRDEAIKLGILPKPPERERTAVEAIDELKTVLTPAPK